MRFQKESIETRTKLRLLFKRQYIKTKRYLLDRKKKGSCGNSKIEILTINKYINTKNRLKEKRV